MNNEIDVSEMHYALEAIANEMQKLHKESLNSNKNKGCDNEDVLDKLIKYKYSLKSKTEEIQKLKQNLNTACFVAKTVTSAKENETNILNNHLNFARNQYLELVQERKEESGLINKLRSENQSLRDKLEYFSHITQLGYRELQKFRNEPVDDALSYLQQLKKIILCCGQYYADYCNEHDKCVQLEQKNRYLNNKLRILEYNTGTSTDFNNHNYDKKHKGLTAKTSDEHKHAECVQVGVVCSEYQMNKHRNKIPNVPMTKLDIQKKPLLMKSRDVDLTIHLDVVKKLLHDQDSLLSELKELSMEINDLDPV